MLILQKDAGVLRTGGRGCQLRRPTVSCKLPLGSPFLLGFLSSGADQREAIWVPRLPWFSFLARVSLLGRPGGAALPGFFRGSYRRVCISLPAFLPPPGYRSWPAPVDPASQWSLQP